MITEQLITEQEIAEIRAAIPHMNAREKNETLQILGIAIKQRELHLARSSFMGFVRYMWDGFVESGHHRIMAEAFDEVVEGSKSRLIINMAPRHTKSELASHYLPAYFLGTDPSLKVMQVCHTSDLAVSFGRKVRNLIQSERYKEVFPDTQVASDSKSAQRWNTSAGGDYYAAGVGAVLAGRGGDIVIVDDPHTEAAAISNSTYQYDLVYDWYSTGPRQRLQPGGRIIVVMTRWSRIDLTGRLLRDQIEKPGSDKWDIIELPAIVDEGTDKEHPIWPNFWTMEELEKTRASIPLQRWSAQYQQKPVSKEGALVQSEWWKDWDKPSPPACNYIIQAWDTAYTAKTSSDHSACTTWGIFRNEETDENCIILLNAIQERMNFPRLKQVALEQYQAYRPDTVLIEAKASGLPLIHELRRIGVPATDVNWSSGQDKIMRVNSVSDIFKSGMVYAPKNRRFAEEVIQQMTDFPYGEGDDYVDTTTMTLWRFREGGFIRLQSDEVWGEEAVRRISANYY